MKIKDLPASVTASKADWLPGTTWLGFTPKNPSLGSRNQCQSTIQKQFGHGYVIEYVTHLREKPNVGFEQDTQYLSELAENGKYKGKFIAVHKLRQSSRGLETILVADEFQRLQDMWSQGGARIRWSVAFPIVQSYRINDDRPAKEILGDQAYRRLYAHPSSTLRPLNDVDRSLIADLEIEEIETKNAWIGLEDEFAIAAISQINLATQRLIDQDLGDMEGMPGEHITKVRRRAAWLADKFKRNRREIGSLNCDHCDFDPAQAAFQIGVKPGGLLDVHHKHPLDEGVRYTTIADFELLCPTCHRIEHARIKMKHS